jgi:phage host-nuclease inhibitor protein Gam
MLLFKQASAVTGCATLQQGVAAGGNDSFGRAGYDRRPFSVDDGVMYAVAPKSAADLKPLDPQLSVEVRDWVGALRMLWGDTGLSINRFVRLHHIIDKGTISRYLNGERVPRDRWFMDKLLAIQADNGKPVTPAVREHLTELHLRALQAKHPHEYRVRLISDELEIAQTGKQEAERYARALEEQLTERNRRIQELTDDQRRLRTAWDDDQAAMQADYERCIREIDEITGQLHLARERAAQAERRCQQLEHILDYLDASPTAEQDTASARLEARREFEIAQIAMARGTDFGWITSVGPGFQITAPSRTICRLLGLSYEELDGSYLLADPLLSRLEMMLGNFGEWALIIGMLTRSSLDGWRSDPDYPHCAVKVTNYFDWLNRYIRANYKDVSDQVERTPARLVDGDSSRNDLRQCLAAAIGDADWPPYNTNRHNTMRLHVVSHPLLSGEIARFEKTAIPFYRGSQVIGYEVKWNAEYADKVASRLIRAVLDELGIIREDISEDV